MGYDPSSVQRVARQRGFASATIKRRAREGAVGHDRTRLATLAERMSVVVLALAVAGCGASPASPSPSRTASADVGAAVDRCAQSDLTQPYQVQQPSMEPTLEPGDTVLVDLASHLNGYEYGNIITFNPPDGYLEDATAIPFIKRVIGVTGDTVEIKDGAVWVDGVQLNESYVFEGQATTKTGPLSRWVVPAGYLFVLGDHRDQSEDSRVFGPIPTSSVIGRVTYRCFPVARRGPIQ
jgi:signal peptidase I